MKEIHSKEVEVLIVGAGPAGLMMACQLAIHQISFRIIDIKDISSKSSGALIVQARSLEIFEQMGIADDAITGSIIADKVNIIFSGEKTTSTNIKDIGITLSKFPFLLMLEQSKTEKLLLKFMDARGHNVERGILFNSFVQDKEGVTSIVVLPDGSEQLIKTKYVVAADGANSTIRNFLNIPFNGKTYTKPIFILDCKAKTELVAGEINFAFSNSSIAGFFPLQDSRWRIDSTIPNEMESLENITFDDIAKDFHLRTKINIAFQESEWFSVTHSHQKYAEYIRVQNCFLVGDSAHINTPIGAQGMNTGLQDAYNLAWKLAFVINKKAKQELLSTYSTERLGISKAFAHYADVVFSGVTNDNPVVKFFRLYVLRGLLKILFPFVEKRKFYRQIFFKSISQIGIHYRESILSYQVADNAFHRSTPRPGDRLPFIEFFYEDRNTNSYKILDNACFTLFIFAEGLPTEIKEIVGKYHLAVVLIVNRPETRKLYKLFGIQFTGYYLIRPDMHISLRSATMNPLHLNIYLEQFLIVQL